MLTEDKSLRLALVEMRAARRHARKALEHLVAATFVEDDPCRGLALVPVAASIVRRRAAR